MPSEIIVGILSLAGTVLGSLLGILAANRLTVYRIEQLEKKVEIHNHVIERVYNLEKLDEVIEEKIKVVNRRIADLEVYHK
ncbi:MAG: hypothetical protein IJY82_03205 [Oscillospiraceae bacterium]|nr:hypothetical protein [Oscillospiraceae bacterium]